MEKIIIYRAEDGEEFYSEAECLNWERKISSLPGTIHFLDITGEDYICKSAKDIEEAYQSCTYIRIDDKPDWKEDLDFMHAYWGFIVRDLRPGTYIYVDDRWERKEDDLQLDPCD
jgi:hypothetical protein